MPAQPFHRAERFGRHPADAAWLFCIASLACAEAPPPPSHPAPPPPAPVDPSSCLNVDEVLPNLLDSSEGSSGRLDPELIRDTIRAQFDGVRQCYESGLSRNPRLGGRITLRFAIELDGTTSGVAVCDNELADCAAVECVRAVFGKLSFPPPEGGGLTVHYPMTLEPG